HQAVMQKYPLEVYTGPGTSYPDGMSSDDFDNLMMYQTDTWEQVMDIFTSTEGSFNLFNPLHLGGATMVDNLDVRYDGIDEGYAMIPPSSSTFTASRVTFLVYAASTAVVPGYGYLVSRHWYFPPQSGPAHPQRLTIWQAAILQVL